MNQTDLSTALRMPEPEIRHTTSEQPTRMIKFHLPDERTSVCTAIHTEDDSTHSPATTTSRPETSDSYLSRPIPTPRPTSGNVFDSRLRESTVCVPKGRNRPLERLVRNFYRFLEVVGGPKGRCPGSRDPPVRGPGAIGVWWQQSNRSRYSQVATQEAD